MANEFRFSGLFKTESQDGRKNYEYIPADVSPIQKSILKFTVAATRDNAERATGVRLVAYGTVADALQARAGQTVDVSGYITISRSKTAGADGQFKYYENKVVERINGQEVA